MLAQFDLPTATAKAQSLGFQTLGVSNTDLSEAEAGLLAWLAAGWHGEMDYMARHGLTRARPAALQTGTLSVLTLRMNYLDESALPAATALAQPETAYVSRYALGRDYHKVLRSRLQLLLTWLCETWPAQFNATTCRVFTDSAPVMEVALATKAGIGWRGKHTLLLDRSAGSLFFIGEIYVSADLTPTAPTQSHCGSCEACLSACPTQAIIAPYRLDARRCLSYLSIEQDGPIPVEFRAAMGNRIYGCDDCQLACPWNKFAQTAALPDFKTRHQLDSARLLDLLAWSEAEFNDRMQGSAIRRIGHRSWQRNIIVALGNALRATGSIEIAAALAQFYTEDLMLAEHLAWAQAQKP
jgi:epoxyqueuosine reductase